VPATNRKKACLLFPGILRIGRRLFHLLDVAFGRGQGPLLHRVGLDLVVRNGQRKAESLRACQEITVTISKGLIK